MISTPKDVSAQELLNNALNHSIDYGVYTQQMVSFFETKTTSGPNQTEELIEYTALNNQRLKRLNKTLKIKEEHLLELQNMKEPVTWLVLTEAWCGDAAQVLPVLNKLAEKLSLVSLQIAYRDQNPELMQAFLTNGAASIPKLIALNKNKEVLYIWGPRPSEATKMVEQEKATKGSLSKEFKIALQKWYTANKGVGIVEDIIALSVGQKSV